MSDRNRGLDGVRGFAALSVALGHCFLIATGLPLWSSTAFDFPRMAAPEIGYRLLSLTCPADAAVMVFFVLSGHVLWRSIARKDLHWPDLGDYVLSRIWRLFPVIVPATLLMAWLVPTSTVTLFSNLVLLRTDILGVTWSLQVEMVGSLAVAAVWLCGHGAPRSMLLGLLFTMALVPLARGTLLVFMPAFALGGAISLVPLPIWKSRWVLWTGILVLLLSNLFLSHGGLDRCFEMVAAFAIVGCIGARPMRLFDSLPAQFLGAISYPFYLIHPFALVTAGRILAPLLPSSPMATFGLYAAASLAVAVPLAWVIHETVEQPAMRWRRQSKALPSKA